MKSRASQLIIGAGAIALLAQGLAAPTARAQAEKPKTEFVSSADLPEILVPPGYEEGYLPKLSEIEIKEVEQFARNSSADLRDLLDLVSKVPDYWEKRSMLKKGVDEIIKKSKPLKTELLMRNVLERAVIMVNLIDVEVQNDLRRKGVVDQEVRLLKTSIKMALGYWEPYLKHINGQTIQANLDLAKINYRDFGVKYANLLWSIANSIYDASAEYKLRMEALKLLMWDLYRDENKLEVNQSGAISKIYNFLKNAPDTAAWSDDEYVERTKLLRIIRNEAYGRLNEPVVVEGSLPSAARKPTVDNADPVYGNCAIIFGYKDDKQSYYCPKGSFGVTYNGYMVTGTDFCRSSIGEALSFMRSIAACNLPDTRGRCKILYPYVDDSQARYCPKGKFGVTYNGYMKSGTCHGSIADAMYDMLSDQSCK